MCANCVTTAQAAVGQAAFLAYVLKDPVHRLLARNGLAAPPYPVAHDVRTVAFLRSLELDPVEILGADVVDAAAAWTPQVESAERPAGVGARLGLARWVDSARPIGSHSLATTQ